MKRWIMHVDMDAFFASVEQHDNAELQGHPVIVGGLSSRGVVATCSYEARAFGVRSAMPIGKARRLCPDGIYLLPRIDRYHEVSDQIHEVLHRFSPYLEPISLDEAFLDISGLGKLYPSPMAVGRAVKEQIFECTGLIASVGIGPNKFLAKLASDLKKPDGLYIIPHGQEAAHIAHLPVRRLWGVGSHTEEALRRGGFQQIRDIASLESFHELEPYCGQQSERIYLLSKGIDHRPIEWNRELQSVGNELTYERDLIDPEEIDREWRYFAHHVAKRLRQKGLKGNTIAIKVRFPDFTTKTRQKRLSYQTNREDVLYDVATVLYNKLNVQGPFRLLGITVSGFHKSVEQESLFHSAEEEPDVLASTLDALEERFGEAVVTTGALWKRKQQMTEETLHRTLQNKTHKYRGRYRMNQYMIETKEIERILASIQENYNRCKELQQQYVAYWETNHLESTETAMEVIEDLEVFAHTLAVLGKQWEEIQVLQETVNNHYLFETISELDGTQEVAGLSADIPMHEGVEGYDVGVALGMVQEERHQEEEVVTLEKVEPTPPTESESSGWSLLNFFGFSSKSKVETTTAEKPVTPAASVEPVEPVELVATEMAVEPIVEECELEPVELNKERKKKRCKHCTEDSPIPEEREKCCIVKQEKKKKKEKKEKSKDKSKSKKKDTSIAKWAKKLSKWERYAEEHGDAWTEKVLEKVAKKAEKKAAKRDAKAIFKKHKLDRFAELSKEE